MAKRIPIPTLIEMEMILGYKVSLSPPLITDWFYSNLGPVYHDIYKRTEREFEEHEKQRHQNIIPEGDIIITHGRNTITLKRRGHVNFYNFAVDIYYPAFDFDLRLLFTNNEAFQTISIAKLHSARTRSVFPTLFPTFFNLPREIRDKIYSFAISDGKWKIGESNKFHEFNFAGGIGDPSGFYFPLSKDLSVLEVNRKMREETLPLVYRRTAFHLDDMDDLIKFLIAVGELGRANIESLELDWRSRSDSQWQWDKAQDSDELMTLLTLPILHVSRCVQLLKQCTRLKFLRLYFQSDFILDKSPNAFKVNPSICELCSLRGIKTVEIWNLGRQQLEERGLVKWLKEIIESSKEKEKEAGV